MSCRRKMEALALKKLLFVSGIVSLQVFSKRVAAI
jgi:hypothetical protein